MNLTSVVIGILLAATALGIGAAYYGGFFDEGSARAVGATATHEAQQLVDAVNLYKTQNEGRLPTQNDGTVDLQKLVDDRQLEVIPQDWSTTSDALENNSSKLSEKACLEVNKAAGIDESTVPQCGDSVLDGSRFHCCKSS